MPDPTAVEPHSGISPEERWPSGPTVIEPLGVYVHLPFCRVKCTYCAFTISTDLRLEDRYGNALLREIESRSGGEADTLYWGGGTPSRSSAGWMCRLDTELRRRIQIHPHAEVTLEANPEDIDAERIALWRSIGINRLSIGVQSFRDEELIPLGRVHGRGRALEALGRALDAGFRVSADLILGLPGQTPASLAGSLDLALETGAGHLSLYMLDLEPGSALAGRVGRGQTVLPPDEGVAEAYLGAVARLEQAGRPQYEISNFARPGEESRHNLRYWERRPYAGLGAGAHSFAAGRRTANAATVGRYIERIEAGESPVEMEERLGSEEERHEKLLLSLRRTEGIQYADLLEWSAGKGELWCARGLAEQWLTREGERVRLTPRGFLLSNELISELF